jgi:hypothetical protein
MLEFHHVGTLVEDIDSAMSSYAVLFGKANVSDKTFVTSQDVHVCFVKTGKNSFIELIQPASENSIVFKLLKRGITYYHIAYVADNYDAMKGELTEKNFKALDEFTSEAFKDKRCMFMFSPEGHLFELIEKT